MLGRSQRFEDLFIVGDFSIEQIKCDLDALAESEKLQQMFDDWESVQKDERAKHWKISYLNVRSLNCNKQYVAKDDFLMSADIFSLGETHLHHDGVVNKLRK